MKLLLIVTSSLIYIATLIVVYFIHIQFFYVDVVFYSALGDALIATSIAGAILFLLKVFHVLTRLEKVQLIVIWLLVGYSLAISGPTVIDRSLSFYILEKLDQRGGAIRQDGFEDVFTKEYLYEHRLVDVRLTEQLESGTIEIESGCVRLTEKGQSIVRLSRHFRTHWLPKKRLLMGEYTDDLTDPFRNQRVEFDYKCQD